MITQKHFKHLKAFQNTIKEKRKTLWKPQGEIDYKSCDFGYWFNIEKYQNKQAQKDDLLIKHISPKETTHAFRVDLLPTPRQAKILLRWIHCSTKMYNETIAHIRGRTEANSKHFKYTIRKELQTIRNQIIENSAPEKTKAHILDRAIFIALANRQGAMTNLRRGHIPRFRLRKLRYNRTLSGMSVEPQYFWGGTMCKNELGHLQAMHEGQPFDLERIRTQYKKEAKVIYDRSTHRFYLIVAERQKAIPKIKGREKWVSLDPGIRTFLTGISPNGSIKIGDEDNTPVKNTVTKGCSTRIRKYHRLIDQVDQKEWRNRTKKRYKMIYRRKISHLVDELHWKSIQYLTQNYQTILLGDMSVKGIIMSKNIGPMTKRVALSLRFNQFRQRLEYKAQMHGVDYRLTNESYTSKVCSNCSYYKGDLGSAEVYDCNSCGSTMSRDLNGARGIFFKALLS